MNFDKIIKLSKKLYKEFGNNPYKICKEKGIIVDHVNLPLSLKGYTTKYRRVNIIFLNENNSEIDNVFTCYHELGHIFLGHNDNIVFNKTYTLDNGNREENEADFFATSMLLNEYNLDDFQDLTSMQLSNILGIDVAYINFYFYNLKN